MAVNIVRFGNNTIMDISDSTVTPETLASGVVAYNAAGERIVGTMAQGNMASMFELEMSVYDLGRNWETADAAAIVANDLNLPGFAVPVGTSKVKWIAPTVEVGTITWSDNVDQYNKEPGTATVTVTFSDGSKIIREATFSRSLPGGRIYGVAWADGDPGYIDTGLTLNYGYRFKARGLTKAGGVMGVLMGCFYSTSQRTQVRQLGGSNKFQVQWASGSDVTRETSGVDVNKEFEYTVGANYFNVKQGDIDYTQTDFYNHITSGTDTTVPILLLNETMSGTNYVNGIGCEWVIYDTDHTTVLKHFVPYHLADDEIVILDIHGLTEADITDIINNADAATYGDRIYRPGAGTLIEVDAA